jgi:hypothetical protein
MARTIGRMVKYTHTRSPRILEDAERGALCLTATGEHTHRVDACGLTVCGRIVARTFPTLQDRPTCVTCAGGYLADTFSTR